MTAYALRTPDQVLVQTDDPDTIERAYLDAIHVGIESFEVDTDDPETVPPAQWHHGQEHHTARRQAQWTLGPPTVAMVRAAFRGLSAEDGARLTGVYGGRHVRKWRAGTARMAVGVYWWLLVVVDRHPRFGVRP